MLLMLAQRQFCCHQQEEKYQSRKEPKKSQSPGMIFKHDKKISNLHTLPRKLKNLAKWITAQKPFNPWERVLCLIFWLSLTFNSKGCGVLNFVLLPFPYLNILRWLTMWTCALTKIFLLHHGWFSLESKQLH